MQRLCLQYIGDASRTLLEKRLSEHKNAAKKHDTNNGLQPTLGNNQHHVDWRLPRQKEEWEKNTGKKRTGTLQSINSSTPPTWSVVWPLIPGYCCLTIQHALDNIHNLFPPFNVIPIILILFLYFPPFSDSIWHNITSLDEISASSTRVWDLHQLSYTYINQDTSTEGIIDTVHTYVDTLATRKQCDLKPM